MTDCRPRPGGHLSEDACTDLLHDLVTGERRARLLAHVRDCGTCQDLLQHHAAERERARALGKMHLTQLATSLPAAPAEEGAPRPARHAASTSRRWALPVGVALAATLAFVLLGRRPPPPPPALQPNWLPPASEILYWRSGGSQPPHQGLTEGLEAYGRKDLDAAVRLLEETAADGPLEVLRLLYLGNAYLHRGEHARAVEVLGSVPFATVPTTYASEAKWSLALAWRGLGRRAESDSLLEELADEAGPVGERARELLAEAR